MGNIDKPSFTNVRHSLFLAIDTLIAVLAIVFSYLCLSKLMIGGVGGIFVKIFLIPVTLILDVVGAFFTSKILFTALDDSSWFWLVISIILTIAVAVMIIRFFAIV